MARVGAGFALFAAVAVLCAADTVHAGRPEPHESGNGVDFSQDSILTLPQGGKFVSVQRENPNGNEGIRRTR